MGEEKKAYKELDKLSGNEDPWPTFEGMIKDEKVLPSQLAQEIQAYIKKDRGHNYPDTCRLPRMSLLGPNIWVPCGLPITDDNKRRCDTHKNIIDIAQTRTMFKQFSNNIVMDVEQDTDQLDDEKWIEYLSKMKPLDTKIIDGSAEKVAEMENKLKTTDENIKKLRNQQIHMLASLQGSTPSAEEPTVALIEAMLEKPETNREFVRWNSNGLTHPIYTTIAKVLREEKKNSAKHQRAMDILEQVSSVDNNALTKEDPISDTTIVDFEKIVKLLTSPEIQENKP